MNKNSLLAKTLLFTFLLGLTPAFARAGGGSNGGGGWVELILFPFLIAYGMYVSYRLRKKGEECRELLKQVQNRETGWDLGTIESIATRVFMAVQKAWCDQDTAELTRLTKGEARANLDTELRALMAKGHSNRMDDLKIEKIDLLNIQNYLDDEKDNFTVQIQAVARDYTVDHTGKIVSANTRKKGKFTRPDQVPLESFSEFWTLEREGQDWVLLELEQASAWKSVVDKPLLDEGTAPESPYAAGTGMRTLRPKFG